MSHSEKPPPPERTATAAARDSASLGGQKVIDALELLGGEQEVIIRNGDQLYRLRRTRQGKLILHK